MPFISQFKGAMPNGGARPNHFSITLTDPNGKLFNDRVSFLCKAASLPGSTVTDIPVMYRGREVHFAGERVFAPWTVTVINETDFFIRDALEQWHKLIQNYDHTQGMEQFLMYQQTLWVQQMNRDEGVYKTYQFINAYPIEIGDIALTYDANNMIEEFPVTFQYDYFLAERVDPINPVT